MECNKTMAEITVKTARRSNHKTRNQHSKKSSSTSSSSLSSSSFSSFKTTIEEQTDKFRYKHSNFASSIVAKALNVSNTSHNSQLYHTIPAIVEPELDVLNFDYKSLIADIEEFIPLNSLTAFTPTKLNTDVTSAYNLIQHILAQPICNGIKKEFLNDISNISSNLKQQSVNEFLEKIKIKLGPDAFKFLIVFLYSLISTTTTTTTITD